jgi:hypothetical protein
VHIDIADEGADTLAAYASIPIVYRSVEVLDLDSPSGPEHLLPYDARALDAPLVKDYDAQPGNHPLDWPAAAGLALPGRSVSWSRAMIARIRIALQSVVVLGVGTISAWALAADIQTPPAPASAVDDDFLESELKLRTVRAQMLSKQVARTLDAAQKLARQDPDAAYGELKRTLTTVISSSDIDPDVREKLRARVQANIEQVLTLRRKVDQERIMRIERMSAIQARELATEQLLQRDE